MTTSTPRLLAIGLVCLLATAACRNAGSSAPSLPTPTSLAQPAPTSTSPAQQAPTPASQPQWGEGDHLRTLSVDNRARTYTAVVPGGLSGPVPLVIVLHGGSDQGADIRRQTGFDAVGARELFVIAYPDGFSERWADGRGTTAAYQAGVDDVAFVDALIDDVIANVAIDETRIFVTGASNGGFMSLRLLCDLGERIAAAAPVIASLSEALAATCAPESPVDLLVIQGTDDPGIPIDGGEMGRFTEGGRILSAAATMDHFATAYECGQSTTERLEPIVGNDPTRVDLTRYRGCEEGGRIDYYIIEGMGHRWPAGTGSDREIRIFGAASKQLDATETIWAFFASWTTS